MNVLGRFFLNSRKDRFFLLDVEELTFLIIGHIYMYIKDGFSLDMSSLLLAGISPYLAQIMRTVDVQVSLFDTPVSL